MSQNNQDLSVREQNLPADLSKSERDMLRSFKDNGMPGLAKITEEQIVKMREMYMSGASYSSISTSFRIKKAIVLFLSDKGKWLDERAERAQENIKVIREIVPYIQNDNVVFLAEISEFFKQYYRKKIEEYNRSGDDRIVQTTSLNALEKYLKCFKLLQEAVEGKGGGEGKNPMVHLHLGENSNVVVSDTGKNENPKENEKLSEALRILAELRKRKEEP
jgi:hypothetical protein